MLPNYLQPRPDITPRQAQRPMAVAPQGGGRLFDDFLDAQVDTRIVRPQPARPALQRGPDARIMAERSQRLAEIRAPRPHSGSWNDAPLIPDTSSTERFTRPSSSWNDAPVIPSPPTTIYRADGSVEGGTLRDQLAYLDNVQRAVQGRPARRPSATQLELPVDYSAMPDDLSIDEFLGRL